MEHWIKAKDAFFALSQREKILITLVGWFAVIFISFSLFIEPALVAKQKAERETYQVTNSITSLKQQIELAHFRLQKDPNVEVDKQYQDLTLQSQDLAQLLSNRVAALVSPTQMAQLLETVLQQSSKLTLISMSTQPSERLLDENNKAGYYIHPVKLVLSGNYFDIETYLSSLEALPVKYYWRNFRYEVKKYPTAELTIEVYTLGSSKGFIGG
ncbi:MULTISPECIES: type II secretion system protein GspM [Aliivibrio]|uniref:MSHA biogenesis protein MshJ n=1 Tax=Aliivibrio finisterrensis TaxID=511998 RepID=A0A4V1Z7U0_9GAMM|nr:MULTISPECIES: type II secretion system protein GspM [Aliivibrio]MDD9177566.1 type II secretion system protein GspM [Aliivibrio sp. A6]RYU46543.1 MSHA biogenesis protein MshJ [Aliivibrio finisterrensis]RYU54011.1 MSHA biogenesis protein MshJ [Aliivibrio finisterrensis]RYU56216.1 MSHA biogenesis protein MshJ [Aliivibrio finisterrensis]RYU60972.1 MSHA biogenesis protein MshJ [Aliivibrio finisterrensis]